MRFPSFLLASLLATGVALDTAPAQVMRLDLAPQSASVDHTSCSCDNGGGWSQHGGCAGGCSDGSCDGGSCGGSCLGGCGSKGGILGGMLCGTTGLGYSGGFGSCNTCGVGGYFGRNIHAVDPCACGGSLIADLVHGLGKLVDQTFSCVLGGIFGGLHSVSCHASGSFAALRCAVESDCGTCGGPCDGSCDGSYGGYADGVYENYPGVVTEGTYSPAPVMSPPASAVPSQGHPTPAVSDPFVDDPVPVPQARRIRRRPRADFSRFLPGKRVRQAAYRQPVGRKPARMAERQQHARPHQGGRHDNRRQVSLRR